MTSSMEPTPTQCSTGILLSMMNEEQVTIIVIVLMVVSLILSCVLSVTSLSLCVLCYRRYSRNRDLQDTTKSNGYMIPVVNEKETESNNLIEPSTDTFTQNNIITNQDVEEDRLGHSHKQDTTMIIHSLVPQVRMGGGGREIKEPIAVQDERREETIMVDDEKIEEKMIMTDEDTNNPLYMKHHGGNTIPTTKEDHDDPDHDYLDVLLTDNGEPILTGETSSTVDNDEENYENFASIKLNEMLNKQVKPRSTTMPNSSMVSKTSRTLSNTSKHDHVIARLASPLSLNSTNAATNGGFGQGPTTTCKHDNIRPETKPKPKHKQRKQSNTSSTNDSLFSPTKNNIDEPQYMKPRSTEANQVSGWQFYKELDFSTVDPNSEYVVPHRDAR